MFVPRAEVPTPLLRKSSHAVGVRIRGLGFRSLGVLGLGFKV